MANKEITQITREETAPTGTEVIEGQEGVGGLNSSFKITLDNLINWAFKKKVGFFDYNDTGTAQSVLVNTFTKLTNDTLGSFTNTSYTPTGVTDIWDEINNQIDFSQLSLGDTVDIRVDVDVTTTSPNQDISIQLLMAVGSGASYPIELDFMSPKSSGTYKILSYNGIYMGDTNTLNFPAEIQLKSDTAITSGIVVNGWYIRVIKR